jgi:hypothetical protein
VVLVGGARDTILVFDALKSFFKVSRDFHLIVPEYHIALLKEYIPEVPFYTNLEYAVKP